MEDLKLENARKNWEEAKKTAAAEHAAWRLLVNSRKEFIESYIRAGCTNDKAQKQFDQLIKSHHKRVITSLDTLTKRTHEYQEILSRE